MILRCLSEAGGGVISGCELEEMVRRESGAGMFQTAAGEITRCIANRIPIKVGEVHRLKLYVDIVRSRFRWQHDVSDWSSQVLSV